MKTLEQGLEEFGVKMTGDLNTQIAKAKQLTNKLRNGRLEEELRETKRERDDLKDQVARLQTEATSPEAAKQKRRCFHIADQLRVYTESYWTANGYSLHIFRSDKRQACQKMNWKKSDALSNLSLNVESDAPTATATPTGLRSFTRNWSRTVGLVPTMSLSS